MSSLRYKSIIDHTGAWLEDIETGQRIRPLIGAKGGTSIPPPSATEVQLQKANLELINKQTAMADRQAKEYEAMLPYLYQSQGYNYSKSPDPAAQQKIKQLMAQEAALKAAMAKNNPQSALFGGVLNNFSPQAQELKKIQEELAAARKAGPLVNITRMTDEQRRALMTPEELQVADITALANDRTKRALEGKLDVDPSVEADLARGESELRQELLRKLGPGAEGSDSWNRAFTEYKRNADLVRYGVRHGEMTTADAIGSNRSNESMRRQQQVIANQKGSTEGYEIGAGILSGTVGSSGGALDRMYGYRSDVADLNLQNRARNDAFTGGLIQGGVGLAGAGIGAAALIAV